MPWKRCVRANTLTWIRTRPDLPRLHGRWVIRRSRSSGEHLRDASPRVSSGTPTRTVPPRAPPPTFADSGGRSSCVPQRLDSRVRGRVRGQRVGGAQAGRRVASVRAGAPPLLTADNHNSVNGIREFARVAGATVPTADRGPELRVDDAGDARRPWMGPRRRAALLAYPAQSNFSGVRHPLAGSSRRRQRGWDVLLDARRYAPTNALDLRTGSPTSSRSRCTRCLATRPASAGWSRDERRSAVSTSLVRGRDPPRSVAVPRPALRAGGRASRTAPRFSRAAPHRPRTAAREVGRPALEPPARAGADTPADRAPVPLRHLDGAPLVRVAGPRDARERAAPTVAFDVLDRDGSGRRASGRSRPPRRTRRISVRTGCFCNPGASEAARGITARRHGARLRSGPPTRASPSCGPSCRARRSGRCGRPWGSRRPNATSTDSWRSSTSFADERRS